MSMRKSGVAPQRNLGDDLPNRHRLNDFSREVHGSPSAIVAAAYNQSGADYLAYADGDPTHLFEFRGPHAYADRRIWALLEAKLTDLRAAGATSIAVLDAGCGPGTWLRRIVARARALGFKNITARGFDVARGQIQRARLLARNLSGIPGINITFDVADLIGELPEADASIDLTLCLYSVLSHLPVASLPKVFRGDRARHLRPLHSHSSLSRQHSDHPGRLNRKGASLQT
jgi:SAM-dependent methyltransferase